MNELEGLATYEILDWDTRFFGFPVARLHNQAADANLIRDAVEWCARDRIRCLYWLADSSSEGVVNTAFDFHFKLVDVRLELTSALSPCGKCDDIQLRPAKPDDIPALRGIAAASHYDSRFCRDSNFPAGAGELLFRAWIERDVLGTDSKVWIYTNSFGAPLAYASCRLDPSTMQVGTISLIAVSREVRGRGIGQALLNRCHEWLFDAGAKKVNVVTQGSNIPAQRLYAKAGYIPEHAGYWFHRWFPGVHSP